MIQIDWLASNPRDPFLSSFLPLRDPALALRMLRFHKPNQPTFSFWKSLPENKKEKKRGKRRHRKRESRGKSVDQSRAAGRCLPANRHGGQNKVEMVPDVRLPCWEALSVIPYCLFMTRFPRLNTAYDFDTIFLPFSLPLFAGQVSAYNP